MKLIISALLFSVLSLSVMGADLNHLARRGSSPNSRVLMMTCPNSNIPVPTCAGCDNNWPEKNGMDCGGVNIKATAVKSVTDGIVRTSNFVEDQQVPDQIRNACPNSPIYSVSHVKFKVFFRFDVQCNCPAGTEPQCTSANGLSPTACAFTTVIYCGSQTDQAVCPVR
ncbi:hypothetical protein BY996DRAFT_1172701 [Phakopsora pachyrhizi]|nr:hypothetical protein BY996DRAFT_1172701 [Phakopsora pachyrhizi]